MRARKLLFVSLLSLLQLFFCHARRKEITAQPPRQSRSFTVEDFIAVKTITSTQISPDGARVLYTIEEADARTNQRRESIWLIPSRGASAVTVTTGIKLQEETQPTRVPPLWSPDNKRFAFLSRREGGQQQIWLMKAAGNAPAIKLTKGRSDVQSFAWSPDGRSIAFIMAEAKGSVPAPAEQEPQIVGRDESGEGSPQIYLLNVETGATRQLTTNSPGPAELSWSPDGRQIAFSAQEDIYAVRVESGKTGKLVERPGKDISPQWSPDGRRIAFFSNYGEPQGMLALSLVAATGGSPQDIGGRFDVGFGGYPPRFYGWSADGQMIYASVFSRMTQHFYAFIPATGEIKQITSGPRVLYGYSLSRDTRTVAYAASDAATPGELFISPLSEWKPLRLTTDTNPQLKGVRLGETEAVRWRSRDGLEIEGLLAKPVGYEPGKRYPLLVLMEGTFGSFDLSFSSRTSADSPSGYAFFPFQHQVYAAAGYLVLMPNVRGSWGYGEEWRRRARLDFGIGPYNDIMTGVDYLIAQGMADGERLGIMGTFFDAYRTAFTITQTDRFKAASVGYVLFNLVSLYGYSGPYMGFLERTFGGPPWQAMRNYERVSPINFAGNLKTPTLIFHASQPPFVAAQSQEFYAALKRNNVPVEYLIYNKQGFGINDPVPQADIIRRNLDWFNRWLKAKPS